MFGTFLESPEHLMFHISNPLHLILRALQPGVSTIPHGGDKTFEHFRAGMWIERQPTCMAGLIVNRTMQTTIALRTTCKSICKPFANELQHICTVFRIHDRASGSQQKIMTSLFSVESRMPCRGFWTRCKYVAIHLQMVCKCFCKLFAAQWLFALSCWQSDQPYTSAAVLSTSLHENVQMFCHHHEEWWRHPAGGHAESNGADLKYETSDARGIPEMSQTFTMHLEYFKFHCRYDGTRRDLVKCRKWLWLHCVWCGATWIKFNVCLMDSIFYFACNVLAVPWRITIPIHFAIIKQCACTPLADALYKCNTCFILSNPKSVLSAKP